MNFNYQFSDTIKIEWLIQNMPQFLFPNLSKQKNRIDKPFLGVLASYNRQPVGLILTTSDKTGKIYRIHSLLVHPQFQHKNIGTSLFQKLEKEIKNRKGELLEIVYREHWKSVEYLKKILKKEKWSIPKSQLLIANGKVDDALMFFSNFGKLNSNYFLLPFTHLKKSDIENVQQEYNNSYRIDSDLFPFTEPNTIHKECSFLLKKEGLLVGWIVSHRINESLNEITALYIEEPYRSFKLAHLLIREVFERFLQFGIPKFLVTSKTNGNAVAKLMKRAGETSPIFCTTTFYACKIQS